MKSYFKPIQNKQAEVIEMMMSSPELAGLNEDKKFRMRLCIEEIVENICTYSSSPSIEVETLIDGSNLVLKFKDLGIPFDPLDKKDPDVNATVEEREVGGLGIFLCKQFMDVISYQRQDGSNILTMKSAL